MTGSRSEGARATHARQHYCALAPGERSIDLAWRRHKEICDKSIVAESRRAPSSWFRWSRRWDWVGSAAARDDENDRAKQKAWRDAQIAAAERHARSAGAGQQVILSAVRALLNRVGRDPNFLDRLETASDLVLWRECVRGLVCLPALQGAERLALGMSTESVEVAVDDQRRDRLEFSERLLKSPRAVDHLIQALDAIAGTGEDTAPAGEGQR